MNEKSYYKWLKVHSGLKTVTQKNYFNAILKLESKYNVNIFNSNEQEFENIKRNLELIDEYNSYNLSHHHVYSAAMKQYMNYLEYMSNIDNSFVEFYKNNKDTIEYFGTEDLREQFKNEYPLTRLKNLSLEEYAIGTEYYRDSLSNKLERGIYKDLCASIRGGTAEKFGIFKSVIDDKPVWRIKGGITSNPEEYWEELRNQLTELLTEIKNDNIYDYSEKYNKLIGMPAVILKLAWIYNENKKFIGIIGKEYLNKIGNIFCISFEGINPDSSLLLNHTISTYLRARFSWLIELDESFLSSIIWNFMKDNDKEFEEEVIKEEVNYDDIFISDSKINVIKNLLFKKKNIILQGSPGVGKTFVAINLLGKLSEFEKIEVVQFHQSYSYEDFIQGYKPNSDGKFILKNGIFYNLVNEALENPEKNYCILIDEINRGNLSKIFGELLLLIESDKRSPKYSLNLTYNTDDEVKFYIPDNVYIVGTMNTADRSLSIVDYALRRRFSFIDVEPAFTNYKFKNFMIEHKKINKDFINLLCSKLEKLNEIISKDLGKGFEIGHSYFVEQLKPNEEVESYKEIIEYEILPLLKEYWYDDYEKIEQAASILLDI